VHAEQCVYYSFAAQFLFVNVDDPSMISTKRNEVDKFIVLVNGRDAPLKILALVEIVR
jgi:hypothetical protein